VAKDAPVAEGQEQVVDPAAYDDPRLKLDDVDGKRVDRISIRFSGTVDLERSNPEHVAKFRSLKLGYVGYDAQTVVVKVTDIGGFGASPAEPEA
jgi:hypothetical protein